MTAAESGRGLDCRIAAEVFGFTDIKPKVHGFDWSGISPSVASHSGATRTQVPFYSARIAFAEKVLDAWEGDIKVEREGGAWIVHFYREEAGTWYVRGGNDAVLAAAICKARLDQEYRE